MTRPVTIPTARYHSAEFASRELAELWPRVWQLACSADHVATPGDWFEHRLGPHSVLIVRGDDGELRAFQNACRHRGSAICEGTGTGLTELRCPFHHWSWDLRGALREVPSRREFGVHRDELPLVPVRVDSWGPLVFVNLDLDAEPLAAFLHPVPDDCAWADLTRFRCTATVSIAAECNWKTLIDGFSETYHVQGIHPEMLAMCDDVHGPQQTWERHGKLRQPYGVASPRLGPRVDDQQVWEGFVEIMGNRVGLPTHRAHAGTAPPVPDGSTIRTVIADIVRDRSRTTVFDSSALPDELALDMHQYNLFPNVTVLVFSDMLQVVRARPADDHDHAWMDVLAFERPAREEPSPSPRPVDVVLPPEGELPLGLVLNQDVANFARAHRGLRQPGLTHLAVSPTEECRIVNLHRNLEACLGISPTEVVPL